MIRSAGRHRTPGVSIRGKQTMTPPVKKLVDIAIAIGLQGNSIHDFISTLIAAFGRAA